MQKNGEYITDSNPQELEKVMRRTFCGTTPVKYDLSPDKLGKIERDIQNLSKKLDEQASNGGNGGDGIKLFGNWKMNLGTVILIAVAIVTGKRPSHYFF